MDIDTLVAAGVVLLVLRPEFVREQIATLLKRPITVEWWGICIKLGPEAHNATGPERQK